LQTLSLVDIKTLLHHFVSTSTDEPLLREFLARTDIDEASWQGILRASHATSGSAVNNN